MSSVIPAIQYVIYRPRVLGVFDKYVCMTQVQGQRKFAAEYTVVAVVHMIYLWVNIHLATPYIYIYTYIHTYIHTHTDIHT